MAKLTELNQYLIREKFLKIFGNKFHIMDENGQLYGFCEQKRFRIKEDIRLYDDENKNNEWLVIKQRNLVDAWGGFDIFDPKAGILLGTVRRKFWKSILRTKWQVLDPDGNDIGMLLEDSMAQAIARRVFLGILPKKYTLHTMGNDNPITMRQKFNPIIRKLIVNIPPENNFNRKFIAGLAIVISALDGRGQR
ncbi:MAG: hypothetical protein VXX84_02275 [Candidatus Thermoplasmatota archaeon]|jgi:uncharacterized protein YxjI|nr:hypothetical protein [Candidatus Thermoplasmatota archaeon]MEC7494069.1 hypothetical protein [Candidatus Thermoplasmatota archaeon]MEC8073610.1 hypothetical protein [Candidatus Thermoplasmatota archaeon]MEC8077365.1 hypothetical protein [Candidatus Thermoplasmatota archaeon]MEC8446604.1 hypothetical protein [Candidatus Thermoplasmatota archaeon]